MKRSVLLAARLSRSVALSAGLCLGLAGCHRKQIPVLPPVQAQVEPLAPPPDSTKPVVIEPQPLPPEPPIAVKPTPKPRRRKTPAPAASTPPPPVQVASAGPPPPDPSMIGSLTAASDAAPEKHQQATEALAAIKKRLAALSQTFIGTHKAQIAQVRNFIRQSEAALKTGDLEGSIQLSTKATVMLDDLLK